MIGAVVSYYKKHFLHRNDPKNYCRYFTEKDFPGLMTSPITFRSGENQLYGNYYFYENYREDTLVIFCHGLGGGHFSYMKEIEILCRMGYRVLAYDNTGCVKSEGESIRALTQSLSDLVAAYNTLKENGTWDSYQHIYVVGHSWGGFAAGHIAGFADGIEKAVVLSGFASIRRVLSGYLNEKNPATRILLSRVMAYEKKINSHYALSEMTEIIKKTKTKYLLTQSTDDMTVNYEKNTGFIKETLPENAARFLIYENRFHNPNYTEDAVHYMQETFGTFNQAVRKKKIRTEAEKKEWFKDKDWDRMTRQDMDFWKQVEEFLKE